MNVCLWSPAWSTDAASDADGGGPGGSGGSGEAQGHGTEALPDLAPLLADLAPRLRVERELIWADGRGLDARRLAERLVERAAELNVAARAGVARVPVAAELAARFGLRPADRPDGATPFLVKERTGWGWRAGSGAPTATVAPAGGASPAERAGPPGGAEAVVVVPGGEERSWMAGLPVSVLEPDRRLWTLLDGVGLRTVGGLAELEREAIEVRLGADAVDLWRLARADDRRILFDRIPPERPHGSMDFVDYVLTDPARLLFTANALLGPLCDGLSGRGEHARALRLTLPLANGDAWYRTLRPARPTASRETWLRLIRGILDRLTVPDAVAGMHIEVGDTEEAAVRQGDLFDRGFATAAAVEAAVARLAEHQLHPLTPAATAHPLIERRGRWAPASLTSPTSPTSSPPNGKEGQGPDRVGFALQLLEAPRRIAVETVARRDHEVPTRLRDRAAWRTVLIAAGPDRISGGQWESSSYAREYYRCVTEEGVPLWIYRDGLDGGWYLHGWWD